MPMEAEPSDPKRFLRIKQVLERVPVSRNTIYRMMQKGDFPKNVEIGSVSFWIEKEVDEWMDQKVAARA